jgi:membrane-bound metal-dependent hydrolase YbcI (DUF457 family)
MLPPGHLAGGFLTATAVLKIIKPDLSQEQISQLLGWGMFFSFAPDLDTFVSFIKEHTWFVKNPQNNHRKFISHAPLLWLAGGLLVYFFSADVYWKIAGLLLWLCSWSHFLLDSVEYGIMWLWPFNKDVFAIRNRERDFSIQSLNFFGYWWTYLKLYAGTLTFYIEISIIIVAIILFFSNHYPLITIH